MSYNQRLLAVMFAIYNFLGKKPGKILIFLSIWLYFGIGKVNAKENVLVIHSYHPELSWTEQEKSGIELGFKESGRDVDVFHEFLDSKRHPQLEHGEKFLDYVVRKYRDVEIDLLMVADDPGLQLIIQQHDRYFSNLPVIFLGINHIQPELLEIPWLTGVFEYRSLKEIAVEATRQMWTDTLVIINDSTATGKANLESIKNLKRDSAAPRKIEVITDLSPSQIEERLGEYPAHVPILILGQLRQDNREGSLIDYEKDIQILRSHLSNPIYTDTSMRLGRGVIGGKIFDGTYHIRQAVELAEQLLDGVSPDRVGPLIESKNRWIFDYRELKRFNIKVSLLPDDSELINIEPPFHEKHQSLIWIGGVSFLAALLVIVLLIEIIRRRSIAANILKENEQRYKDLAEAGANVFWELNANLKYCYVSGDTKDSTGLEAKEMLGRSPQDIYHNNPQFDFDWEKFEKILKSKSTIKNFTFSLKEDNKSLRIFRLNGNPLFDSRHKFIGYRGIKREITAEHNLSKKIAYQATYDALTGLLNRREFDRLLKDSVKRVKEYRTESVFCYLDLDRFKIVNDTAGHLVGDRLLAELASLFASMIRKGDTLGRLGGDEFGLLLEGCSIQKAKDICEQFVDAIKKYRFKWQTLEFDVGVSIGIVPISVDSTNATELLSRADLACYQAKNLGRGRVYVAQSNDTELDSQQTQMAHIANVSQAIAENRFYLVKQPIKPTISEDRQYSHYEVLLRLKDRNGKIIPPERFIPVAERYGVITIVDRWVLETALQLYPQYFAAQRSLISINLSGASINDERFTQFAIALIEQAEIPGDRLCFEITETAAISKIGRAQQFIAAMKKLGVKFALDDFGSGVASFAYLKNLPVDYLKIDGSLVKNITCHKCDLEIVNSLNHLAHLMGMQTIAEFVENDLTLRALEELNVDYVQGYGIGNPEIIEKQIVTSIVTS